MGIGEAKQNTQMLEAAQEQLATIAGQRPSVRRAKKSVANFKLREGMPVGVAVTLRRARMWEFLDRLTSIAMPRIRDFRGLSAALLRRPRQLLHGRSRADHLPRDRLRLDRRGPGPRRDDHHHGRHRRGGLRPARRARNAVLARRDARARRTPRRRPRRSAARRRPASGPRPRRPRSSSSRRRTRRPTRSPSGPRRARRARKARRRAGATDERGAAAPRRDSNNKEEG